MKFCNKIYFVILFLMTFFSSTQTDQIPLEKIHNCLFDFYFPEDTQLSEIEKQERIQWRIILWQYINQNPQMLSLLSLLQPDSTLFPTDLKKAFDDLMTQGIEHADPKRLEEFRYALRRHPDIAVCKFADSLRKMYSYFIYSGPLTEKLSGAKMNGRYAKKGEKSKLAIQDNQIVHKDGKIDYLIIGSGPAGSLIAHELTRLKENCRIVILDAGSFVKPQSIITESLSELMESKNQRSTVTGGISLRNGWIVGGGTTVNLDLAFSPLMPRIRKQIQSWVDNKLVNGNLFHDSKNDWKYLEEAYAWVRKKLTMRTVKSYEINENNKILLNASDVSCTYDLNEKEPTGYDNEILKISAVDAFLMPALMGGELFKGELSIISDVKVTRIVFDDIAEKKAVGAEIVFQEPLDKEYIIKDINGFSIMPGSKMTIEAQNIIISAGTLGSAEILLRSNISNENIGKGIVLHPSMGIFARFNREINVLDGLSAAVYAPSKKMEDNYFFESMSADPAFTAILHQGSGNQILDMVRNFRYFGGFGVMLIDSVSFENNIFINSQTDTVEVAYQLTEFDKQCMRSAVHVALEMLLDQGAQEIYLPTSEPLLSNNSHVPITTRAQIKQAVDNLHFIENQNILSSAHMQGSNKMGSDPKNAVVSFNFKVWNPLLQKEIPNLYVVDSSIFPTSVGANPMQSIYSFAKLFVDKVIWLPEKQDQAKLLQDPLRSLCICAKVLKNEVIEFTEKVKQNMLKRMLYYLNFFKNTAT